MTELIHTTFVIDIDTELTDPDFEQELIKCSRLVQQSVGSMHGRNALKILGKKIASCDHHIDNKDNISTIDVSFRLPPEYNIDDIIYQIRKVIEECHLNCSEFYQI